MPKTEKIMQSSKTSLLTENVYVTLDQFNMRNQSVPHHTGSIVQF
jgi:hypothetical protein